MEQDSLINSEEGIVYSQAIHYANRMVYMRIPLDASEKMPAPTSVPTPVTGLAFLIQTQNVPSLDTLFFNQLILFCYCLIKNDMYFVMVIGLNGVLFSL